MTTKKQSTKPAPSLSDVVQAALTSTNYHDETGVVPVNVVDAMMAIANAIHRLAASHEAMAARGDRISQLQEAIRQQLAEDGSGHA